MIIIFFFFPLFTITAPGFPFKDIFFLLIEVEKNEKFHLNLIFPFKV